MFLVPAKRDRAQFKRKKQLELEALNSPPKNDKSLAMRMCTSIFSAMRGEWRRAEWEQGDTPFSGPQTRAFQRNGKGSLSVGGLPKDFRADQGSRKAGGVERGAGKEGKSSLGPQSFQISGAGGGAEQGRSGGDKGRTGGLLSHSDVQALHLGDVPDANLQYLFGRGADNFLEELSW